ncbi:MAG: VOC family protein [Bauldia sp.]|nr:VOC family protein [Bauldia sp.]
MIPAGLLQIAVKATDLDESIAFYRDQLGLTLLGRFDPPGIAFFDLGGTRLMLAADAPPGQFYLRVDGVEAARAELIGRGVAFETEPVRVHEDKAGQFGPPGLSDWMAFFRDPAGNIVALAERR